MGIHIDGISAVTEAMERKMAETERKASRGLERGCRIVEGEARNRCPVDTGELRRSITSHVDGMYGVVGTNKEYAGYVEFGTHKMKAQPYLISAFLAKKYEVLQAITNELKG